MNQTVSALSAQDVAVYLREQPEFLQQYPDLALSLVVPREEGAAASLVGYQLDILRGKNRDLSRRLHELTATAQVNEQLAVRTHQLTLALMRQTTAADTVRAMVAALIEDFAGDQVAVVLHAPVAGLADAPWLQIIAANDARLSPFAGMLAAGEPVCGRLSPKRQALLYGTTGAKVRSTALLPLPGLGMLAVGSADANRFWPGMGTVFLDMMRQALVTALARFD